MIATLTQDVTFLGEEHTRKMEYHIPFSLVLDRVVNLDVELSNVHLTLNIEITFEAF